MFKKIYNLIKILRKLAVSGAIDTLNNIRPVPVSLKFVFFYFFNWRKKTNRKTKKRIWGIIMRSIGKYGNNFY